MMVNPFRQEGAWHKACLHTHTTTSDGEKTLAERIAQYREKGYSVLAVTDHEKTNDVRGLSSGDFLVLGGMETHPALPGFKNYQAMYHLLCLNIPFGLAFSQEDDADTRIRMVRAAGGEVVLAHPYWCGHTINEMRAIHGYMAIEVYNATCTKIGKGFSSTHWDDLLDSGSMLPAVACDDVHGGRDIFMGWTMIKSASLDAASIMEALKTGSFYSSCGPVIEDCEIRNGELTLKCSPVREVHLICQRANGCSFYADGKKNLTEIKIPVDPAGKRWKYLRIEVMDNQGRHAWTNPFIF